MQCQNGEIRARRFVGENGEDSQALTDISTRRIVPVELNSYLCRSARAMRDFHEALGNAGKVEEYERRLRDIRVSERSFWTQLLPLLFLLWLSLALDVGVAAAAAIVSVVPIALAHVSAAVATGSSPSGTTVTFCY